MTVVDALGAPQQCVICGEVMTFGEWLDWRANAGGSRTYHRRCMRCPRCGSYFVSCHPGQVPVLLRCLCCLHGWMDSGVPGRDGRPQDELEAFTTHAHHV